MDPQNPFAIWTWSYILLRNGRVDEASELVRELNTQHAGSVLAQPGTALLPGVRGESEAALEAVTDELRAGETEQAFGWLENTVRIGNVNYPVWSQHDEWVAALRTDPRFNSLMIDVKNDWLSGVSTIDNH